MQGCKHTLDSQQIYRSRMTLVKGFLAYLSPLSMKSRLIGPLGAGFK